MNPLEMLKRLRGIMVEMTNVLSDNGEEDEEELSGDEENFDS